MTIEQLRPDIVTRPLAAEDEASFRRLHDAARLDLRSLGLAEPALEALLEQQYVAMRRGWESAEGVVQVLIIEVAGKPVGWGVICDTVSARAIVDINVEAGMRDQTIGERVLRSVIGDAETRAVHLHVRHGNPARRLYERLGFREAGRDQLYAAMVLEPGQLNVAK